MTTIELVRDVTKRAWYVDFSSCDGQNILEKNIFEEERPLTSDEVIAISQLSVLPDNKPVGSFQFKGFQYPGDIDLFERIQLRCLDKIETEEQLLATFKNGADILERYIIDTVKRIATFPGKFQYSEMKLGKHMKGPFIQNTLSLREIDDVYKQMKSNLSDFYTQYLQKYEDAPPDVKFHQLATIRWTYDDVMRNFVEWAGRKYTLAECIYMRHGDCKLDTWGMVDYKWKEITNVMNLSIVVNNQTVNYTERLGDYLNGMLQSMKEHMDDYIKVYKRGWMVLRVLSKSKKFRNKAWALMVHITPLFSQPVSAMSQAIADIECVSEMYRVAENSHREDFIEMSTLQNMIANVQRSISTNVNPISMKLSDFESENFVGKEIRTAHEYLSEVFNILSSKVTPETVGAVTTLCDHARDCIRTYVNATLAKNFVPLEHNIYFKKVIDYLGKTDSMQDVMPLTQYITALETDVQSTETFLSMIEDMIKSYKKNTLKTESVILDDRDDDRDSSSQQGSRIVSRLMHNENARARVPPGRRIHPSHQEDGRYNLEPVSEESDDDLLEPDYEESEPDYHGPGDLDWLTDDDGSDESGFFE